MILAIFIPHVHARANNPVRDWYEGFPREFEAYFLEHNVTGNIFCPLTWSGRITLVTEGKIKIYIDGRLLLYPSDFFNDYLDILHRRGLTASQIEAYDITYLFLPMELVERSFAHCLKTGGTRRVYLRGRANVAKRYLIHVSFNLGVLMRSLVGVSTLRDWTKKVKRALEARFDRLSVQGSLLRTRINLETVNLVSYSEELYRPAPTCQRWKSWLHVA